MCCGVSLSYSWTFFLLVSSLNLVRLLKIPFVLLSSYRYSTVYHHGSVVRVSYVCTCCIFSYIRRYSSLSFLGVSSLDCARRFLGISSGLLDPSLARGAGEIPKNDRGVGSFRIVGGTAKGPLVCFKRTSRSLFGGWERGSNTESRSFSSMYIFLIMESNKATQPKHRKGPKWNPVTGSLGTSNYAAVVRGASFCLFGVTGNHHNHETSSHLEDVIFQARFVYVSYMMS